MEGVLGEIELSHFDIEVPHLRNLYEKLGPRFGNGIGTPPSSSSTGFGFTHDGSIPNVTALLSTSKFVLTAPEVRDIAAFLLNFPTETRPAVGRTVTVPPGAAPTGSLGEEALLATLVTLGDVNNANRHCDLIAATRRPGGSRNCRKPSSATSPARANGSRPNWSSATMPKLNKSPRSSPSTLAEFSPGTS